MLAELTETFGAGGMGALMLVVSLSFLAWMPAIASVVVSERGATSKLATLILLGLFPPSSLVVLAVAVKNANAEETYAKPARRPAFRSERCGDRVGRPARATTRVPVAALEEV